MDTRKEIVFTTEENTENDKFNYLGAIAILELSGKKDLLDLVKIGDWRCLPDVYKTLSKMIIDESVPEDNGSEIVEAYFNLIKTNMGVRTESPENVPKVLEKLKIYAEDEDKEILDSMIEYFSNDNYIDVIILGGEIVEKMTVLSSLVHDCSGVVLSSLIVSRDSDEDN